MIVMPKIRVQEQEAPQLYAHRDFRSRSRAVNRSRKQSDKYYGYRGVNPSWVGEQFLDFEMLTSNRKCISSYYAEPLVYLYRSNDPEIVASVNTFTRFYIWGRVKYKIEPRTWTRADMYEQRETNIWPLDRRHHHSKRKHDRWGMKITSTPLKQKQKMMEWEVNDRYYRDLEEAMGNGICPCDHCTELRWDEPEPETEDDEDEVSEDREEGYDATACNISCGDDFDIVSLVSDTDTWDHISAFEMDDSDFGAEDYELVFL